MITSRERLRRCFFYEELDRPGVYSRTGFPAGDPTYDVVKAYLRSHSDLKQDWAGAQFKTPCDLESFHEPYSEDFQRCRTVLHTPAERLGVLIAGELEGASGPARNVLVENRGGHGEILVIAVA